ncbi:hypothetical protein C5Y96_12845 [Blastopirellula marina]|uniref:Uncharacterized protein n=1 Tax=Blastopirellula marina TaxID=124 RepID=A0A2S8FGE7_9BACT|nr:hypothetical protein C5Y96_12845 [Blastopirellula marina]RCS51621.1 hypothetical protein DTL36_12855 [Bremerella cremea]
MQAWCRSQIAIFAFEPEKNKPPAQATATPAATNPGMAGGSSMPVLKSVIPTRYNNPATSGLTFEIKPGDNQLDFELQNK